METVDKLYILGTGNAMVTKCYNTCFAIKSKDEYFLVDAGGGNQILANIDSMNIDFDKIRDMFITHAHTDHLLGAIWVIRKIASLINSNKYNGIFNIYSSQEVAELIITMCKAMLKASEVKQLNEKIKFIIINDGFKAILNNGIKLTFFDIQSTKKLQYGFRAILNDDLKLVCLGDEPYNEKCRDYVYPCDWLLCESFCLYSEKDKFKPYEKHHSTALDAGLLAQALGARNLIVYHTEDKNLAKRKELYTKEIAQNFGGSIYVPDDLDVISLI
ncbi:MAG: MBL fold metallo-hydrolase [Muribaculaceae bacterium]|nr:MBL fold metallo-hydrolase [Muribaculaceae bacterium]